MSDRGRSFVTQHSPFRGATFFVHYFLGDLENSENDHKLWLSISGLAERIRMHRNTAYKAVAELVEGGWLTELDGGEPVPYKPREYRFEFPKAPVVFHPDRGLISDDDSYPQASDASGHVHSESARMHSDSARTCTEKVHSVHSGSALTKETKTLTELNRRARNKSGSKRSNERGVTEQQILDTLAASGVVPDFGDEPEPNGATSLHDVRKALPNATD